MTYHADHLSVEPIRGQAYGGVRVRVAGNLGNIDLPIQLDVAFGDVITPSTLEVEYPTLLGLPAPVLRVYPIETVVAEKFEAIVRFSLATTRLKDYYDLWSVARTQSIDGATLVQAVTSTFLQRGTEVPTIPPSGMSAAFVDDRAKQRQWAGLLNRISPTGPSVEFQQVVEKLNEFLMPPALASATGATPPVRWDPDRRWR
jgi:hypothetical protein